MFEKFLGTMNGFVISVTSLSEGCAVDVKSLSVPEGLEIVLSGLELSAWLITVTLAMMCGGGGDLVRD